MILYNENAPYPAQWLRNLSEAGHIPRGKVDERSIRELRGEDLRGVSQFHAFAGIGAWSYALRLAEWPDVTPVWTGSCPCQPFSSAGKRKGTEDDRHLWPEWFRLIRECRPAIIFGEQVASRDGRAWLDSVSADLEELGYAVGASDLCAAGVGAPHARQRLFFVAHTHCRRFERIRLQLLAGRQDKEMHEATGGCETRNLGNTGGERLEGRWIRGDGSDELRSGASGMACGLGNPDSDGGGRDTRTACGAEASSPGEGRKHRTHGDGYRLAGSACNPWRNPEWIPCKDGKARPAEPGTFPLADGTTTRVGRLRAYGNAIVPQVAALFIRSVMDILGGDE